MTDPYANWEKGMDKYEILDRLIAYEKQSHFNAFEKNLFDEGPHLTSSPDLPWGDEIRHRVEDAYIRFLWGQNWTTGAGARKMEKEIITIMGNILGNPHPAGFLTNGGSESNIVALIAAKGQAIRKEFPEINPHDFHQAYHYFPQFERKSHSVVFSRQSHYSIYKGCALLGLTPIAVPPDGDAPYKVSARALRAAVQEDTIAIVGTAGTWPFGSIDPIAEIGEIASDYDLYFHVDSCFGGFIIPFLERVGYYDPPIEPWDFRVPAVSSISADLHKNGMTPPGASSLYFRDDDKRLSAKMASPYHGNLSGTKGTGPSAAAWTMFMSVGLEGYKKISSFTIGLQGQLDAALAQIPGLKVAPDSKINLTVVYSEEYDLRPVVQALVATDWGIVTNYSILPIAICICCMPQNYGQIEPFVEVLRKMIQEHAVPIGSLPADFKFNQYGMDMD